MSRQWTDGKWWNLDFAFKGLIKKNVLTHSVGYGRLSSRWIQRAEHKSQMLTCVPRTHTDVVIVHCSWLCERSLRLCSRTSATQEQMRTFSEGLWEGEGNVKKFQERWLGAKRRSWTHLYANWRVCSNYTDVAESVHLTDVTSWNIMFCLRSKLTCYDQCSLVGCLYTQMKGHYCSKGNHMRKLFPFSLLFFWFTKHRWNDEA